MHEANIETDEIDLKPVEDITDFSDSDHVPVEHVNFEFEQTSKLHGIERELTIFNDTQCYQKIRHKHRNKYKFRVNLASLDPRPFRVRHIEWKYLYASLALWALDAVLLFTDWIDRGSITFFGTIICLTVVALMMLLAFFYLSHDTVYFRSRYGKIRLLELANNNPDRAKFRDFISRLVAQIKQSRNASGLNQSQRLASELKELRRLKDESILPEESYEKAKRLIFRHEGFNTAA